ncbi:MAG: hypothetical protein AAGA23_22895, partial [Pseudomonadota bacterium]
SMAHVVDVFGTVLELAGASTSAMLDDRLIDAQSFAGQLLGRENADARAWNYAEIDAAFLGGRTTAMRNQAFKLISSPRGEQLYHLAQDPAEMTDLIASDDAAVQQNYQQLKSRLEQLLVSETE